MGCAEPSPQSVERNLRDPVWTNETVVGPREVWEVDGDLEISGNRLHISPLGTVDGNVIVRGHGASLTGRAGKITGSVSIENADTVRLTNMTIGTDLILRDVQDANLISVEIGGNLRSKGGESVRGEDVRVGRTLTATLSIDTMFRLSRVEIGEDLILLGEANDSPCSIHLESLGGTCDLSGLQFGSVDACSIDGCDID